jgi:2-polyprenyl-3-methyl-5-hydroxy-6-metoxy-1,4-benzoquinol methylase
VNTPLTDEAFWDEFWSAIQLPALIDEKVRWQLALARVFRRFLTADKTHEVFEVGCAPGRWLVWFNETFGYRAFGCDLSRRASETTRANLEASRVPGEIYTADITTGHELPQRRFDVVVSIGLIEHFADTESIVRRHVELLKPGGTLVLQVPNLAGRFNHWLLRSARMQSLLDVHNLGTMRKAVFRSLAERLDLDLCYLEYVGGFDPGLVVYNHSYKSRWKRPPVFYALWALEKVTRRWPRVFLGLNHASFSSQLVGVFHNGGQGPSPSETRG